MNKIGLIIWREYITRVRKKTFIIMTLIGPVLFAGMILLPGWFATLEEDEIREIVVVEYDAKGQPVPSEKQFFRNVIPDKKNMKFTYLDNARLQDILVAFDATEYDGVLYLPQTLISSGQQASVEFYYRKPPSVAMEMHISESIEKFLFKNKLIVKNIPTDIVKSLETKISLSRINWKNWQSREEDSTDIKRILGYLSGILIYMFIFMFGAQVMRGILEEKTSRVIEVIISSVSPFQLMMGKIIGIALLGLTQFVAWILLTLSISAIAQTVIFPVKDGFEIAAPADIMSADQSSSALDEETLSTDKEQASIMVNKVMKQISQINIPLVIGAFIFYFLGGYLLYGSMFAAIGAAVDSETDTQQFMLPITIPLIIGLLALINSFLNPSGKLAVIFSIIPFTSPIVMMARIPFDVPVLQLLLSAGLLVLTFLATTWMAAKIYRTGILMYGKKPSYAELWKWIRYR